jgi:hypothetical protein
MKTKTLLSLCLFLGIAATQLSAQNTKSTGWVISKETFEAGMFSEPIFSSDGKVIDWLNGPVTAQYARYYKDGVWLIELAHFYGDLVSDATGEVFRINDYYMTRNVGVNGDGFYIARGSHGSRLIIFYHVDMHWSGEPMNSDFLGMDFILVKAIKL